MLTAWTDDQTGQTFCLVRFANRKKTIPLDDLEAAPTEIDPWEELSRGRVSGPQALRSRLTFERIRRPPGRIAHSFGSARATLYPYQFKPLLKLLDNEMGRLLIADEVGLGKTIEAGYILKELRSRMPVERVLILVPARLLTKWKREMEKRFDEVFEVVRRRELIALADRLRKGAEPGSFRWITSYESAREPEFYEVVRDHSFLDVLIADEAHRMRNLETNQFRLGRALAAAAEAVVFLTATPIQIQQRDLWALLHLLDPHGYQDEDVFYRQLADAKPLQRAIAALRAIPPARAEAVRELEVFGDSLSGARGDLLGDIVERLEASTDDDRTVLLDIQQDLAEYSPTAALISRTRKREVLPNRPIRMPQDVVVHLSDLELSFIDSIVRAVVGELKEGGSWGQQMKALSVYRYASSSIPAALDHYRDRIEGLGLAEPDEDDDVEWSELADGEGIGQTDDGFWAPVRSWLSDSRPARTTDDRVGELRRKLEANDTKFNALLGALTRLWADDEVHGLPPRKVIIFSYFRKTVGYLGRRLEEIGCRLLHGGIPVPDRDVVVEDFATDAGIRVLVSSEVGGEGLDLQFASTVVNYDLPWNPMVVDQRIGRIDRLGQRSPRLAILNLVAVGTVEERIIYRLYDRIGLFEEVIGDLEPILARELAELVVEGLTQTLSPAEEEERLKQAESALRTRLAEANRLGNELDRLMAADQVFLDEIDAMLGGRRTPTPVELREFCAAILRPKYAGTVIPIEAGDGLGRVELPAPLANAIQGEFTAEVRARNFCERARQGAVVSTFDSEVAMGHAKAELVTPAHPLVRFAARTAEHAAEHQVSFWAETPALPWKDPVLFGLWRFSYAGGRSWSDLVGLVWHPSTGEVEEPATSLLTILLDPSLRAMSPPDWVRESAGRADKALGREAARLSHRLETRARDRGKIRFGRRRDSLKATWDARERSAQERLRGLQVRGAAEFSLKMANAKLEKVRRGRRAALDALETGAEVVVDSELLLVGGLSQAVGVEAE